MESVLSWTALLQGSAEHERRDAGACVETDPDVGLLSAFASGDPEALATIYRRHARAVYRFVFYMTGSRTKADELTQEVFVWLMEHPGAYDPGRGTLPVFLGGVARQCLRRQWRQERRWAPLEEALAHLSLIGRNWRPEHELAVAADVERMRKTIALLPPRYREAIVLCDLEELSYREAAAALGCSVGTVRSRLHRGRTLLARKLKPQEGEGNGL